MSLDLGAWAPPSFPLTGHCSLSWALPCLPDVTASGRLWFHSTPGAASPAKENARALRMTKCSVEERKASLHSSSQEAEERQSWAALSPQSLTFFTPQAFPCPLLVLSLLRDRPESPGPGGQIHTVLSINPLRTTKKASFLPGSVGSTRPALPLPTPECLELDGDRGWQKADPPAQGYQDAEFHEGTYAVTFQGMVPP